MAAAAAEAAEAAVAVIVVVAVDVALLVLVQVLVLISSGGGGSSRAAGSAGQQHWRISKVEYEASDLGVVPLLLRTQPWVLGRQEAFGFTSPDGTHALAGDHGPLRTNHCQKFLPKHAIRQDLLMPAA